VDRTTIVFDCPVPVWLVGPAALLLLATVVLFVRRDVARLKPLLRRAIMALVVGAGMMLAGLLLSPKLIRTWPDPQLPRCVLLVDGSRSMLLSDTYRGVGGDWLAERTPGNPGASESDPTREDVVRLLLADDPEGWRAQLARRFDLSAWRFADDLDGLPLGEGTGTYRVDPQGYVTALGDALESASKAREGVRPQALILLSDGAWNTGRDPSEVAAMLGRVGTPVFVVGVGDPDPPRDVAIQALRAPRSVLLGDEVQLSAEVAATGLGAARVTVELSSAGQAIGRREVVTLPSGRPVTVHFSHVPERPGGILLTASVSTREDEVDRSNNAASVFVVVAERTIRALLVEEEPRWEFRFLRNVMERDPAVEATVCLLRPGVGPVQGEGYASELPISKKDLAPYELVILGDVARERLPDVFLTELAGKVRHGGGALIVIAGKKRNYLQLVGTPVGDILPVTLQGALVRTGAGGPPFPVELTHEGSSHLITRLSGQEQENERTWSRLPEFRWSAGVGSPAPGATALLAHPYRLAGASKLPLLAVHRVGAGKVMFVGTEETWRWRREVGDRYHYRFWAQAVRWMVKRQFSEGDPRGRLSVDRNECDVGEPVEVEAYCLAPDGFPLADAQVWVVIEGPGDERERRALEPAPGGWGLYRTTFTPAKPGSYTMQPVVARYGKEPLSSSVTLEVTRRDLEKNFLAQDRRTLNAIAQASGGEYLDPGEVDRLPSLLSAKVHRRMLTAEYSPWRHWLFYTILALMLGAAWLMRKRSGLA